MEEGEYQTRGQFDKYTPLNTSWENLNKYCVNIEFQKTEIKNPFLARESFRTNKSKYLIFHKSHNHTTNDCIQIKDIIEGLIKRGHMSEYTKDSKRDWDDSPKNKFSAKNVDVVSGDKEASCKEKEV